MTTALTLADQGYAVHLVEREAELGGNLRGLHSLLPTADGAPAIDPQVLRAELEARVVGHPQITLHLESEVEDVHGFVGNFSSRLHRRDLTPESIDHSVLVVAVGAQEYRGPEYGYGTDPRILTQQEFEGWLSAKAEAPPRHPRVVMIQCVGPAEQTCARTCCTTALKNALRLKDLDPTSHVVVLFRDMRTYGFKERLYTQARARGVVFLRHDEHHKPQVAAQDGKLRVDAWDASLGEMISIDADLVVLSMPMVPSEGSRRLATTLKVPVDADGWFLEAHVKLRPVEFANSGIYLAGAAHYPKLLEETLAQAQAAASRAATVLARPTLSAGGVVAMVNEALCVGCLTCVRVCPLGIPIVDAGRVGVAGTMGTAYIEASVCQGCGTCVGECPAGAIELLHYRHDQVERQVVSLFAEAALASEGQVPG